MKIKSHLNASLDFEGICVSEALVKRTLKAIKQSEGEPNSVKQAAAVQEGFAGNPADAKLVTINPAADILEEKSDSSDKKNFVRKNSTGKVIHWYRYIFRTAGVAAAALLMVVGLRYMSISSKKDSTGMPEMLTAQDTAENETAASGAGSSAGTAMQPKESLADSTEAKASDKADQTENSESKVQGTEKAPSASEFTASPAAAAYEAGTDSKAFATTKENSSPDQTVAETADSSRNQAEAKMADNKHSDAAANQIEASGQETAADASENDSNSRGLAASLIEASGEADTKGAGGGGSGDNSSGNVFSGSTKEQDSYTLTSSASSSASFRDIFLSDPEQAQYVKIKDDTNNTELMLTASEDIQSFYAFMDQHKFSSMSNTLTVENYTVEVKSLPPDEYVYTITIGDGVSVVCDTGDTDNIGVYSVSDPDLLLTNMENFYNAYSR